MVDRFFGAGGYLKRGARWRGRTRACVNEGGLCGSEKTLVCLSFIGQEMNDLMGFIVLQFASEPGHADLGAHCCGTKSI